MSNYEPLVPVDEFGMGGMHLEDIEAYAAVAGFTVRRDYLDRPAVSLADAYKIAEARRKAKADYDEEMSRRAREHTEAVCDLAARVNAAYASGRDEYLQHPDAANMPLGSGEIRAAAVNAGLVAARLVWAAAPPEVRAEVRNVDVVEDSMTISYDLGVSIPGAVVTDYLHRHRARW